MTALRVSLFCHTSPPLDEAGWLDLRRPVFVTASPPSVETDQVCRTRERHAARDEEQGIRGGRRSRAPQEQPPRKPVASCRFGPRGNEARSAEPRGTVGRADDRPGLDAPALEREHRKHPPDPEAKAREEAG